MLTKNLFKAAFIAISGTISISAIYAQNPFVIKGNLGKEIQGKIRITYKSENRYLADSAQVKDGIFVLKGAVKDPGYATIVLNPSNPKPWSQTMESLKDDQQGFFLEEGKYVITSTSGLRTAFIKGGKEQEAYSKLMREYEPINLKNDELRKMGQKFKVEMNDTGMVRLEKESRILKKQKEDIDSAFIADNPDSFVAFSLCFKQELSGSLIDLEKIEAKIKHFNKGVYNSDAGRKLLKRVEIAKNLSIGKPAIDFSLKDTLGNSISLHSLKGKYVLLVFWCPNSTDVLSQAHNINTVSKKFKDRNLVVLSIAYTIDNRGKNGEIVPGTGFKIWKECVNKANMQGITLCDNDGISGPLAKMYDLSFQPQCFFIDPDGTILARNLYPNNSLSKKLETLIGK